jgi:hypothetical protein
MLNKSIYKKPCENYLLSVISVEICSIRRKCSSNDFRKLSMADLIVVRAVTLRLLRPKGPKIGQSFDVSQG